MLVVVDLQSQLRFSGIGEAKVTENDIIDAEIVEDDQ